LVILRKKAVYYFAYASNLNRRQMAERCPDSKPGFTANLPNYRLIFAGWSRQWKGGVASIQRFTGERITGAIYEISDKCLQTLDRHEGYPTNYDHLNVVVFTEAGERIEALTYIKVEQLPETRPSQEYLTVIQQGYRDWDIV